MSKFGKLFGFLKKNKKDQDSDEEAFYDDIEESEGEIYFEDSDDDEEEFFEDVADEEDLSEQTVIMDSETAGEELIPHVTNSIPEVPADTDLKFPEQKTPKVPTEKEVPAPNEATFQASSDELDPGMSLDDLFSDDDSSADDKDNSIEDLSLDSLGQDSSADDSSIDELSLTDEDLLDSNTIEGLDTLDESQLSLEDESEVPDVTSPNYEVPQFDKLVEDENEYEESYSEDEEPVDQEFEEVYASLNEEDHTSEVLEIDDSKLSFKDRLYETKTRIADRFRNLRHKDFEGSNLSSSNPKFDQITDKLSSVNWANIPKNFFAKNNRPKLHRVFQGTVLITIIYGTSTTLTSILAPSDSVNNSGTAAVLFDEDKVFTTKKLGKIQSAQIFKTEQVKEEVKDTAPKISQEVCKEAQVVSRSGVKLVNTVVLQDSVKSIASVQVRSSPLRRIREGETLENKYKVDRIERLRLIVRNMQSGECEAIESDLKSVRKSRPIKTYSKRASQNFRKSVANLKGIKTDGNNFEIERSFLKDKMKDVGSILTQAKGVPMYNGDGTISFKITDVEPGGVFAHLGIENNDIISEINGEPITELNTVMNLFGKVQNLSNLNLTVKRGGTEMPLNYTIK